MSKPHDHPSDDRLSARLDDALAGAERDRIDAHLEGCEGCRARLADLAALDASLASALSHDPGEAYFGTFPDRVAARIAEAPAADPAQMRRRGGWASFFGSPRRLAALGSALAVIVAAGLTWQMMQRGPTEPQLLEAPAMRIAEPEAAAPRPAGEPQDGGAGASGGSAPLAEARSDARADDAPPAARAHAAPRAEAAPGRMQEMRTLENGEQVPVAGASDRLAERDARSAPPASQRQAITDLKRRLTAQPLERSESVAKAESAEASKEQAAANESEYRSATPAPAPAGRPLEALGGSLARAKSVTPSGTAGSALAPPAATGGAKPAFDEDASRHSGEDGSEWCGVVRDTDGRPVPGATVTVIETGRSVRTGADGAFCVPAPGRAAALSVLAMGFEPVRLPVAADPGATPIAVALKAVPALGRSPLMTREPGWRSRALVSPAEAARWDSVAARADEALAKAKGAASRLTAMRSVADARMRAWRAAANPVREVAARAAVAAYLEAVPEGPRRAEAVRWRDELPH